MQRRNNQLLIDAVNMHRLTNGLRPLRQANPSLYELAQNVADKMIESGRLVDPNLKRLNNKKTVLVATLVSGETTAKEFVYNVNDSMCLLFLFLFIN